MYFQGNKNKQRYYLEKVFKYIYYKVFKIVYLNTKKVLKHLYLDTFYEYFTRMSDGISEIKKKIKKIHFYLTLTKMVYTMENW